MVDVPNIIQVRPWAWGPTVLRAWAGEYGADRGFTRIAGQDDAGRVLFENNPTQGAFRHAFVSAGRYIEAYQSAIETPIAELRPLQIYPSSVEADKFASVRVLRSGYLNEWYAPNQLKNHLTDLWNNYEGVKIAREIVSQYGINISNNQLADIVASHVRSSVQAESGTGRLITRPDLDVRANNTAYYDENRLPSGAWGKFLAPQAIKNAFPGRYGSDCFIAGTKISMDDGNTKCIENISVGDIVKSFDRNTEFGCGVTAGRRVSNVFRSVARQIISLRELKCTPGHIFLSRAANGDDVFISILEILKSDGIIIDDSCKQIRARSGATVESLEDRKVVIAYKDIEHNSEKFITVRAGLLLNFCCTNTENGRLSGCPRSLMEWSAQHNVEITLDGHFRTRDGQDFKAIDWPEDSTPFDTIEMQNWIVATSDGLPYTPPWIANLMEDAESGHLRVVGEIPRAIFPGSTSPICNG